MGVWTCWCVLVVVVLLGVVNPTQAAPDADLIADLPGLNYTIAFKHYSGYLNGGQNKRLHYWFVHCLYICVIIYILRVMVHLTFSV